MEASVFLFIVSFAWLSTVCERTVFLWTLSLAATSSVELSSRKFFRGTWHVALSALAAALVAKVGPSSPLHV